MHFNELDDSVRIDDCRWNLLCLFFHCSGGLVCSNHWWKSQRSNQGAFQGWHYLTLHYQPLSSVVATNAGRSYPRQAQRDGSRGRAGHHKDCGWNVSSVSVCIFSSVTIQCTLHQLTPMPFSPICPLIYRWASPPARPSIWSTCPPSWYSFSHCCLHCPRTPRYSCFFCWSPH